LRLRRGNRQQLRETLAVNWAFAIKHRAESDDPGARLKYARHHPRGLGLR